MDISKENINQIFERFKDLNVLIVGDVMMDAYIFGKVERISPEAPVPVVTPKRRKQVRRCSQCSHEYCLAWCKSYYMFYYR